MTAGAGDVGDAPKKSNRGGRRVASPGTRIGRPTLSGELSGAARVVGCRMDPAREAKLRRIQQALGLASLSAVMLRLIDDADDPTTGPSKDEMRALRADPAVPEPSASDIEFLRRSRGSSDARDQRLASDIASRYPEWARRNGFF